MFIHITDTPCLPIELADNLANSNVAPNVGPAAVSVDTYKTKKIPVGGLLETWPVS
jgi:hypothetical protein